MTRKPFSVLLLTLLCSVGTAAQTAPAPQTKINIIIDRETIRFAPQELALEMRLVVTDQSGAELYDSGTLSVSTLDWLLRDSQGGDLKGGLYLYTLTAKDAAGEARQRRGYLIVNRTGDADRIYIATGDKVGIGAGSEVTQVTVIGSPETTVGGAELSGAERGNYVASGRSLSSLSERVGMQRDAQGRSSAEAGKPGGAQQYARLAPTATPGRLAKFAADGVTPVDTQLSESNGALLVGNAGAIGNIQIFGPANADVFAGMGPDVVNGPAFNYGYAGSSFGRSAGFFNVRPDASAVAPNPSLRFLTANQQRMIITNTGNVGIGTTNPLARLQVASAGDSTTAYTARFQSSPSVAGAGGILFDQNSTYGWKVHTEGTALTSGTLNFNYVNVASGASVTTNPLVLSGNGKVGIGTSNPSYNLHVVGENNFNDIGNRHSVYAHNESPGSAALYGTNGNGYGVIGHSVYGYGIYGIGEGTYAGYFAGNVYVGGALVKPMGSFKIDHPLDPENKYLNHSFVESPDMMNIYNGNIITDENGKATITLPAYFEALNRDFRYQLTVIGAFAQAIVAEKVKDNRFVIRTDMPNIEVSWQVTGIRQDAYAEQHRLRVEEDKTERERGHYLHPELFKQPEEKGIEWARHPEMMRQMKQEREKDQKKKTNQHNP